MADKSGTVYVGKDQLRCYPFHLVHMPQYFRHTFLSLTCTTESVGWAETLEQICIYLDNRTALWAL
jgi:hypothetical protein